MPNLKITLKDLSAEQLAEWLAMIDRFTENVVSWTATGDARHTGYREAKPQRAEPQSSSMVRSMTPQRVEEPAGTASLGDPSEMITVPDPSDERPIGILGRIIEDNQNKTTTPEQDI